MASVYNGRGGKRNAPRVSEMNDSAVVLWFDPGKTTGWAVLMVHPEALVSDEYKILSNIEYWSQGQIDCGSKRGVEDVRDIFDGAAQLEYSELAVNSGGEHLGVHEMLEMVDAWPGACVGLEDFILRTQNRDRDALSPVRVTSAFDYGLYLRGLQSYRQQPSEAKQIATDARLDSWDLYRRDGEVHARDAMRHAICWMRKLKTQKRLREECLPHLYGKMRVLDVAATAKAKAKGEPSVYKTVYGPYYVPPGMTYEQVVAEREAEERRKVEAELSAETGLDVKLSDAVPTGQMLMVSPEAAAMVAEVGSYKYPTEASA